MGHEDYRRRVARRVDAGDMTGGAAISPEQRGKRKCPDGCDRGGFYDKLPGARCATFRPCKTCNGTGEVDESTA